MSKPKKTLAVAAALCAALALAAGPARAVAPGLAEARSYEVGVDPTSVTAADLGGSKRPDLAVANSGPDTVSVLINTTRGRSTGP